MSLPYVALVLQQTKSDCGIAALGMLIGRPYPDVLAAAVTKKHPAPHAAGGMTTKQLVKLAKRLGCSLSFKRAIDLESDTGLLTVEKVNPQPEDFAQHLVLLKFGLIFDTDGTVHEPEFYFSTQGFRPVSLLVEMEG